MNFTKQSFTEENLVKMATRGDLEAFNQLVLRYQDVAYHHAYTILKDSASAEDAAQDSFIRAFQNMAGLRGGSFRAWILKIVTNSAYDAQRRLKRHPIQSLFPEDEDGGELESADWLADPTLSTENIVEQSEFFTYLSRLLAELPQVYHAVLTLIDVYGFDYAEAAQIMNDFLPIISSAFVPTKSMPGPVRAFAENQPVTFIADARRSLLAGSLSVMTSGLRSRGAWGLCSWLMSLRCGRIRNECKKYECRSTFIPMPLLMSMSKWASVY